MKSPYKFIKITGLIILAFLVFIIITVVLAKVYEDKLASFTIEKLESEINAPMSIGKVSLIPFFSFPRLSAEINKLYIGDPQSKKNDTLFFINSLKVGLDSWDLISGIYTIDELEISGLDFEYIIDKQGESNIDFLMNAFVGTNTESKEDTVATNLDLSAEKFKLENIHISYFDSITNTGSQIAIPQINIKAKTKNDKYNGKSNGSFVLSHCQFENTKVDQMESCKVSFNLLFKNDEVIIENLAIGSEGIELAMEGVFNNKDGYGLEAIIKANALDLSVLKKYIPDEHMKLIKETEIAPLEPVNLDLNMLFKNNNLHINKFLWQSNGIDLGLNGTLLYKDTLAIDANIETLILDFNLLKKYISEQYLNKYGIIDMGGIIDITAKIAGQYAESDLLPTVDANVDFKNLRIQTVDYPQIDTFNLKSHINTGGKPDFSEASIHIANAEIRSAKSNIQLTGNVVGIENPKYNFRSNLNINLAEFDSFIPDSLARNLEGNIRAIIGASGTLPKDRSDSLVDYLMDNTSISLQINEVSAILSDSLKVEHFSTLINYSPQDTNEKEIQIDKLKLKSEALGVNLHNTSLSASISGKVSDPLHIGLKLKSFNIQNGSSRIAGNGEINNFETPEFHINTSIYLKLQEVASFIPDTLIKRMSGTVKADINSHGKINIDSIASQFMPILFESSSFDLKLNNIALVFPDSMMKVNRIFAHLSLEEDLLNIDHLSGAYNGLKFKMNASKIRNLYKAVLLNQKEELYVYTDVELGKLLFDDFKHLLTQNEKEIEIDTLAINDNATHDSATKESRNWTYLIHGFASVNSIVLDSVILDDFIINRLHIKDMSSLFKLTDSSAIFDQFKLKVFEGEMNNSVHYKVRKDGTQSVSTHHIISNMNMRTMLRDMDNFGLDSLISFENISGLLSLDLNTFVPINDSVRIDKMMVSGDVILEKGGVYNFPPAQEISNFTSIKELDNIQFKTLRSNIFMFKNKLYVPRTNIVSNAIDIAAFGMQDLDGNSEYHMEIHLSNILFGKSKRRNKKQNKSGEEIDKASLKKSSRKIRYTVVEGKSKTGLDSKNDREDMMNKIRVQKKMLDFIFFPKNIHYNTNITPK